MKKIWIRTAPSGELRVMASFANQRFSTLGRHADDVDARAHVARVAGHAGLKVSADGRSAQ